MNGDDISKKFGKPLIHNGSWKRIRRARYPQKDPGLKSFSFSEERRKVPCGDSQSQKIKKSLHGEILIMPHADITINSQQNKTNI